MSKCLIKWGHSDIGEFQTLTEPMASTKASQINLHHEKAAFGITTMAIFKDDIGLVLFQVKIE